MFDSYGREIAYLRVSVTDRCNLRCVYCMPPEGVEPLRHEEILTFEEIAMVVGVAVGLGFRKVRLTGGEPLARKGIASLVRLLRPIRGLETLAMTTNGTLLAPLAAELARA
ncbi:MAG: radical SAM protein, partial [Actinomycetota bacterium]